MADWPPKKNAAFIVIFPIYDADGDLVAGATGLDSEVSIDGGTFTDVTPDEATEIATSSGMYELDLSTSEMNGDRIAVKTTSNEGKPAVNVMYTAARQLVDLAFPVTSGRGLLVETDNVVHADLKEWLGVAPLALISQRVASEVGAYTVGTDFSAVQKTSIQTELTTYDAVVPADLPANFASMGIEADGHVHGDLKEWLGAAPNALQTGRIDSYAGAYAAALDFNATQKASIQTEADAALVTYDALVPADLPTNFASMGIEADGHVHGDIKEWLAVAPNVLQSGRVDAYAGAMAAGVIDATAIANAAIDAATFTAGAIDAAALNADAANEIADAMLQRDLDQVESAAPVHSMCAAALKAVSRIRDNAGTLEVYETDGVTLFMSQTVTTDAGLNPVDELTAGV